MQTLRLLVWSATRVASRNYSTFFLFSILCNFKKGGGGQEHITLQEDLLYFDDAFPGEGVPDPDPATDAVGDHQVTLLTPPPS